MHLSRRVARFNTVVNNRVQGVYAWLVPPWAVIVHVGRRSGRLHRTPVLAFAADGGLIVALLYGEESQWLRNLRVHGGHVVREGRTYRVERPVVVDTSAAGELDRLPRGVRAYCRLADKQVIVKLGERRAGFGPGPGVTAACPGPSPGTRSRSAGP